MDDTLVRRALYKRTDQQIHCWRLTCHTTDAEITFVTGKVGEAPSAETVAVDGPAHLMEVISAREQPLRDSGYAEIMLSDLNRLTLVSAGDVTRPMLAAMDDYVAAWNAYLSATSNGYCSGTHYQIDRFPFEIFFMLDLIDPDPAIAAIPAVMNSVPAEGLARIEITSHFVMNADQLGF